LDFFRDIGWKCAILNQMFITQKSDQEKKSRMSQLWYWKSEAKWEKSNFLNDFFAVQENQMLINDSDSIIPIEAKILLL